MNGGLRLTVIVATRNRCEVLRTCLEHLNRSAAAYGGECEVIIADNGSSDETRVVAEAAVETNSSVFRYLYEPRKGKSLALNAAIRISKGDILAFTDDDCYVDETWLGAIAAEFSNDDSLGGLGGRVELFDPQNAPSSARTGGLRRQLASVDDALHLLIGCNIALRRRVVDMIGFFDPRLGPGTNFVAEDVDFLYRAFRSGEKLLYVPEVLVRHDHRRPVGREADLVRERYARGRGAVYGKHVLQGDRTVARQAYWEVLNRIKASTHPGRFRDEMRVMRWLLSGMLTAFRRYPGERRRDLSGVNESVSAPAARA